MKRVSILLRLLIAATLFFQSIFLLQAQNTEGTEFWLTYGDNFTVSSSVVNLQIRIVAKAHQTTGKIHFTNLGTYEEFIISANQVYTYPLSTIEKQAVYNQTMNKSNRTIYIETSKPVTVYAMSQVAGSTDATNILPVTALGMEYYQTSYTTTPIFVGDAYAVIAIENNTEVLHNNSPIITLNAGEVYYHKCATCDMTGNFISSNKPIAFFSLSPAIKIKHSYDCVFQQLAPINTWGKEFFVPVSHIISDHVRIVVAQNGTFISQTGGTVLSVGSSQTNLSNLQAGQFVELEVPVSSDGCTIIATKPVSVCTFLPGSSTYGDAAMCWLPPKEQSVTSALIAPFIPNGPTNIKTHYVTLCTPFSTKDNTRVSIGGASPIPLSGGTNWIDNVAAGMSYYKMPLTNNTDSYHFTNPAGFLILCHGIGSNEAYYYPAYSAMRDLSSAFYANDIHYQDLKDNSMCEGDVHFLAEIEGLHPSHPDRITWWINGTEYLPAKALEEWYKPFTVGEYEIRMDVIYENLETASKTGTLIIKSCNQSAAFFANNVLYSALKDTTFCNKNVNFRAEIEGLHPTAPDSIIWYIDNVFETSQATWNKPFENGTYEIKLVVHYDNDTYATLTGTLKIQALWIKIRNVRY